ncbi:MAG TPA: hypothetical protein PK289_01405 [Bacteroidia bacterium]|nr:hypothetical protein [Bacteroidia bacterium]HRG51355.1 hypothetical protein [Bacteroidia bacterium]
MRLKSISFLLVLTIALSPRLNAQTQDLTIVIKEPVINKIFTALGEIKGTEPYSFLLMNGTYTWELINPHIQLHPNRADFITDAKVTIGKFGYTMHVTGNVEVCYEPLTNLIYIEITEAKFPLNMMFLGNLKHLWDVDLAKYFETPFMFEGPLTVATEFSFPMPDGTNALVYTHALSCDLKVQEKQIMVAAEVEFVNRRAQALPSK